MNKEEIQDILEELHLIRPEILKPKAKKLFEAIMSIADEKDELEQQNKKYKEVIDKIKDIFNNGHFEDGCDCLEIEELLDNLKEVE